MAFFDDRRFLLSHINHSFITGDDTGICEVVMLDEEVFENQHQQCLNLIGLDQNDPDKRLEPEAFDLPYQTELLESDQGQSYDIASELDYISHRRRSNTAQRLDRLTKEKKDQSKTRTIVWRCPSANQTLSEAKLLTDELADSSNQESNESTNKSEENNIPHSKSKSPPAKSGLTRLLEKFPSLPKNPFDEYAQFDGGMSESLPVKKIMIFIALNNNQTNTTNSKQQSSSSDQLDSAPKSQIQSTTSQQQQTAIVQLNDSGPSKTKNLSPRKPIDTKPKNTEPLEVVVISSATIRDLIGLICWQYTNEGREPKLHYDINRFCLRIAEDNGEVDPDFPSLNPKEQLSKFNFPMLAFAEKIEERHKIYPNGCNYIGNPGLPNFVFNPNVITKSSKSSKVGRLAAFTRIIFKDAKLETEP